MSKQNVLIEAETQRHVYKKKQSLFYGHVMRIGKMEHVKVKKVEGSAERETVEGSGR